MRRILALGVVLAGWLMAGVATAQDIDGAFYGIDEASGARIEIRPDSQGYSGTFYDARGASQRFEADAIGDTATAVLDMDGRTVLLRMAPLPYGLEVALIPFDGQGRLVTDAGRVLAFVRQGLRLPEMPEDFVDAPRRPGQRIAGNSFVASYQFWEPVGVVNGYLGLPDRFRTLMRMFPAVQLDVIWKLCLAPGADRALGMALRGQDVSCPEVIDTVKQAQESGRFDAYKAEVEGEREALQLSVRCADGYVESKADCDRAARRLAEAAISMRTVGMVLKKYR